MGARFPGHDLNRRSYSAVETFETEEQLAAIVCWDALFHIDRALHAALFTRFASMLTPGGRLMLTVGGSAHPAFTDTMFGEEFFYNSHLPEVVLELLAAAGFQIVTGEFTRLPTGGRDKGRFAIVACLGAAG